MIYRFLQPYFILNSLLSLKNHFNSIFTNFSIGFVLVTTFGYFWFCFVLLKILLFCSFEDSLSVLWLPLCRE